MTAARKFSAEQHLSDYLEDFHRELLPKTYQGHRLPEWLIKVTIVPSNLQLNAFLSPANPARCRS